MIKGNVSGIEKDITKVMMRTPNGYKEGWEVRDASDRLIWGRQGTISSVPPISFRGGAGYLESYQIFGNTVQNGTPTPESPVDVVGVGQRTANLFDLSAVTTGYRITWATGALVRDETAIMSDFIPVSAGIYRANASFNLVGYAADKSYLGTYDPNSMTFRKEYGSKTSYYDISDTNVAYVKLMSYSATDTLSASTILNTGTTALPYEPYGYKIPISCGGVTTPIYLGQTQTVRRIKKIVLTGKETGWTVVGGAFYGLLISPNLIDRNDLLSTHFFVGNYSGTLVLGQIRGIGTPSDRIVFNYDNGAIGVDGFKSWLAAQYAAGTPVTVWYVLTELTTDIVNEPLMKIGNYADTLDSTGAGIMIPTVRGSNTLSIGTTVQPSNVLITGHIKPTT